MTTALSTVEEALDALRRGLPVLVTDDEDRENEGDVILAAQTATEQWLAWTIRWSSGVVCAPMPDGVADRLELPPMVSRNEDPRGTAYTISVDAREGVSTGISAADRARTVNLLADPATEASDLVRPGHVFPLRAREGGVLVRAGHTEAAVDLARLAGCAPAGVICEIMNRDGSMARVPDLIKFAKRHGLLVITIADLIRYRMANERLVKRVATATLPTEFGEFRLFAYDSLLDGQTHVALVCGEVGDGLDIMV